MFFFNDTATTEIYTYVHTLSLHDALPICDANCPYCNAFWEAARPWVDSGKVQLRHILVGIIKDDSPAKAAAILGAPDRSAALLTNERQRSEEHTSELQSLMRNSYAVFCLKKKKAQRQQEITIQLLQ